MNTDTHTATQYRKEIKENILQLATQRFRKEGVKAVKMDQLSQHLAISKRTLYELYPGKEALLLECIERLFAQIQKRNKEVIEHSSNVLEVIVKLYMEFAIFTTETNELFFEEITKFSSVQAFIASNTEKRGEQFTQAALRGVEEGLFRPELDYELIATLIESIDKSTIRHKMKKHYTFDELFGNTFLVILRGICTQRGIDVLEGLLSSSK